MLHGTLSLQSSAVSCLLSQMRPASSYILRYPSALSLTSVEAYDDRVSSAIDCFVVCHTLLPLDSLVSSSSVSSVRSSSSLHRLFVASKEMGLITSNQRSVLQLACLQAISAPSLCFRHTFPVQGIVTNPIQCTLCCLSKLDATVKGGTRM